ncbi:MAG TPA: GNAT family N-acetyltransferase [Mesorhizobium sp.]|jgi:GNAT superfamily N-acetyltransferase|uniref:GNAT family N-acetyltransferase n=1 Tax=Mesorhizobium sp. TaxID=1871066 RepID=UPI002DDCF62C|nr:GNAT family N-acetyltransferase [Mesorhizobium sp.]HEV2507538.1 GNAT family N-acetyltransferase [Mesorhizobium sp.]
MSADAATVRLAGKDDVATFKKIRLEALQLEPAAFASRVEDWEALPDEEWLRRVTNGAVFIAFREGEPVGLMGLLRQQSAKSHHRATIVMVYVRAGERGTGTAKALLGALTRHARDAGILQLELTVSVENAGAQRFYLREGFVEIGRLPAGLILEGSEIDEVMMAKRIG